MLVDYTKVSHIYIVCGKTDMRRGIDGLAAIIMEQYELDVYSDALFLFCGGSLNKFKALYWEDDGFLLPAYDVAYKTSHLPRVIY